LAAAEPVSDRGERHGLKRGRPFSNLAVSGVSGLAAGGFGLVVGGPGRPGWFALAVAVNRALALLEFSACPVQRHPLRQNHPGGFQFAADRHPSGAAVVAGRDLAAAVVPVSGAAICAWLLLQPVRHHRRLCRLKSSGCSNLGLSSQPLVAACVTSADGLLAPDWQSSAGRPAQAGTHPAAAPAAGGRHCQLGSM